MNGRPLEGRRIVLTRQASKSRESVAAIEGLGGRAILLPAIEIDRAGVFPDFEAALRRLDSYDFVIITSANTAQALIEALAAAGLPVAGAWRCVAIGRATARSLEAGGIRVDAMPEEAVSEGLAECLGELSGKRVLMPGSDLVRGAAAAEMRSLGAHVDEVVAYRTVAAGLDPEALAEIRRGVDALLFTSPSTLRNFDEMTEGGLRSSPAIVACIGPVTAEAAMALGYEVAFVPADHSMEGLIDSLAEYWRDAGTRAAKGANA
ncbi:MAG TPA: uroporphyrinogen-III synthase [Rectinemataceae bacterium]|nr:uroporphyrinogen-III synthase [Rectinemataceae bacterium]